jgi:signal peptidase I
MSSDTPSAAPPSRPSRILAVLISLIAPGAGHVYAGASRRGTMLLAAMVVLQAFLLAIAFLLPPTFRAVVGYTVIAVGVTLLFCLAIVVDSVRLARHASGPRARWYMWLGAILAVWVAFYATSAVSSVAKQHLPWRSFAVPSSSMEPTIRLGEWILADRRYYPGHAPARGDLVIYRLPTDNETIYIKRIVGLPGDRIAFRDGHAIVNGTEAREPFADFGDPKAFYNNTAEVTVPPGHLFVAGDNRANSSDSRVTRKHGTVPVQNLVARATEVFMTEDFERAALWIGSPAAP